LLQINNIVTKKEEYQFNELNASLILDCLTKLQICFATELITTFKINGGRSFPFYSSLAEENYNALVFLMTNKSQSILYVNLNNIIPPISIETAISIGVCQLLGLDTIIASSMSCIIFSLKESNSSIDHVVDQLKIGNDELSRAEKLRGVPGEFLFNEDVEMLELRPFRVYRIGEIVAYESNDLSGTKKNLQYGKVVEIGPHGEAGLRKISIKMNQIGNLCTKLSSDIYTFKSARDCSQFNNKKEISESKLENHQKQTEPEFLVLNDTPQTSNVSNNELLGALAGLLTRVGVPMDMEKHV
jgi:hypothetical protein